MQKDLSLGSQQTGRVDLGKFSDKAHSAIISAPGAKPRNEKVVVKAGHKFARKAGVLVNTSGGVPMLEKSVEYEVQLEGTREEKDRHMIDGLFLEFGGHSEYEYWSRVALTADTLLSRKSHGSLKPNFHEHTLEYSFACVWVPDVKGHCGTLPAIETLPPGMLGQYKATVGSVCKKLAEGYASEGKGCCNCKWVDAWGYNVMRCHLANQKLLFAYLKEKLYNDQPQFQCKAKGHEGLYYVGIAQKVELEWAQDQMGFTVRPITEDEVARKIDQLTNGSLSAAASAPTPTPAPAVPAAVHSSNHGSSNSTGWGHSTITRVGSILGIDELPGTAPKQQAKKEKKKEKEEPVQEFGFTAEKKGDKFPYSWKSRYFYCTPATNCITYWDDASKPPPTKGEINVQCIEQQDASTLHIEDVGSRTYKLRKIDAKTMQRLLLTISSTYDGGYVEMVDFTKPRAAS